MMPTGFFGWLVQSILSSMKYKSYLTYLPSTTLEDDGSIWIKKTSFNLENLSQNCAKSAPNSSHCHLQPIWFKSRGGSFNKMNNHDSNTVGITCSKSTTKTPDKYEKYLQS